MEGSKTGQTTYVVLEEGIERGNWTEVGEVAASGAESACRTIYQAESTERRAKGSNGEVGRLVAVPLRSWKPVTYEVEEVVRVRVSRG